MNLETLTAPSCCSLLCYVKKGKRDHDYPSMALRCLHTTRVGFAATKNKNISSSENTDPIVTQRNAKNSIYDALAANLYLISVGVHCTIISLLNHDPLIKVPVIFNQK